MSNIKKMEPLIENRIEHWINKLDELFVKTHKTLDFSPWAVYVAYDIISEVGFGEFLACYWFWKHVFTLFTSSIYFLFPK